LSLDYTQSVTSLEFSQFNLAADDGRQASLFATAHVDGSVRVYKFDSFDELSAKNKECRPDLLIKDHFYSANKVHFAQNLEGH